AHPAHITFINGYRVYCYSVAVRKDSTRWRLSDTAAEVAIPTDSIYSINIPDPQTGGGIALGILGGAVLGGAIGAAATPAPSAINLDNGLGLVTVLDIMGGAALGILLGGTAGAAIGASNGTIWTRQGVPDPNAVPAGQDHPKLNLMYQRRNNHAVDTL